MKDYFLYSILCTVGGSSIAKGSINRRRLHPNAAVVDFISNTEIFRASKAIMVSRVDPADASGKSAPCSSPSKEWLRQQVSNVSNDDLSNFFDWYVYTLPFAYKLYVEPREKNDQEYFGLDGEYTQETNYIHEQAEDFWSNSGVEDDIHLLCAHGSDLADRHNKLIPTLEALFGKSYDDDYTIFEHATDIQELIMRLPGGYNYPLLTFNAFATDEVDDENDSPSIIIGDGYFEFQQSVGLGSGGPEYALTHEHAHHLQFSLEEESGSRRDIRREELMADAFSAYFLAHSSGGDMTAEKLSNTHEIAFSVGDCETSNTVSHHGTPTQRRCATRWGASVAASQDATNLDLVELVNIFDTWYEGVDDVDDLCQQAASVASITANHNIIYSLEVVIFIFESVNVFGF
mmetsp:Transcript_8457/g.18955  ORF Transcript_8457/g.18955 Transcript_8457/m.18955 type:complete len:403 (+) Transcript_8457:208-1416(+)